MSVNNPLRSRVQLKVRAAIQEARAVGDMKHSALIGTVREILVEQMLRPVLPPEIRVGTGKLVDSHGNLSDQIDIILYAPHILPPALYDARTGIFPIESCLYTIEVKSTLTATELDKAITNACSITRLERIRTVQRSWKPVTPGERWDEQLEKFQHQAPPPIITLFAFGSDISSKSELERYLERYTNANKNPAFAAFCVAGRGYWYRRETQQGNESSTKSRPPISRRPR